MENIKFISIIWLFPIIFMLHDFEEIIFIEWWTQENKLTLFERYPKVAKVYPELSTAAFALAVCEEFIVIIMITVVSVIFKWYYLWFGVLVFFFVHLVVHLIQWLAYKKYIPAIVTTIPGMVYSIYAIYFIYNNSNMNLLHIIVWSILGTIIGCINIIFALKLAGSFNRFLKSYKAYV